MRINKLKYLEEIIQAELECALKIVDISIKMNADEIVRDVMKL